MSEFQINQILDAIKESANDGKFTFFEVLKIIGIICLSICQLISTFA